MLVYSRVRLGLLACVSCFVLVWFCLCYGRLSVSRCFLTSGDVSFLELFGRLFESSNQRLSMSCIGFVSALYIVWRFSIPVSWRPGATEDVGMPTDDLE